MPSSPHRLQCAEIWSGNDRAANLLEMPGFQTWVHSVPAGPVEGGDIHYVSLCPSCNVSRVALADVSGHGQAVATVANRIRELMERYLTDLDQRALMRDLNCMIR